MQPDDNDDDDENTVPLDDIRPSAPSLNQSSIKNNKLQRRQTIGTVQGRRHQTALQQLQALFWPTRETHNTINNNNQLNEHEQMPMITKKTNY